MYLATAHLKSVTVYGQSKAILEKKGRDETHDHFEERTWKQRCHVDKDGIIFIPPTAFKNCLSEAAKYKGMQIPGRGLERYTKHIEAGVLCVEPVSLGVHIDDVQHVRLLVPADGKRGGSKRVWKNFPFVTEWQADVEFAIFDEIVDEHAFTIHLIDAGQFIGVGYFRPRNNGYWGRFSVEGVTWKQT